MNYLFLDFETRSQLDVTEVGAYRYAEHESTEVICAALAFGNQKVHLHRPGESMAADADFDQSLWDCILVAHNVEFEREIIRHRHGYTFPLERCIDTAALARRMSLPGKLEDLAAFFGYDLEAKKKGGKAILQLSKPKDDGTFWTREEKPELFADLEARCVFDVEVMREIFYKHLLPLDDHEKKIWQVTMEMNEAGVGVDLASIPLAKAAVEAEVAPKEQRFVALTGLKVKSYAKVAEWCGLDNVRKPSVRKALRDPATRNEVREALEIYQYLSKSSVSKLDAMQDRACKDGRVRGSFLYCGADRTGRWSSVGLQLQNFKRGSLGDLADLCFDLLLKCPEALDIIFGGTPRPKPDIPLTIISLISEMLRGFLVADEEFEVGDFAQIEARVLNWLAGQQDMVDLFARKGDPYKVMAAEIYRKPLEEVTKDERFMGKQAVLGAGYGLGAGGFQYMLDDIYDVQIDEDFAKEVVDAYRRKHPRVVHLWDRIGKGFLFAVANNSKRIKISDDGLPLVCAGVIERGGKKYAFLELPSGRRLYYADPRIGSTKRGPAVYYFGRDKFSKGWTHIHTYGGKIIENLTQAISRDLMALAILRLRSEGYTARMTVHDEVVVDSRNDLKRFRDLMVVLPPWAKGLPLEVDVFACRRYRK